MKKSGQIEVLPIVFSIILALLIRAMESIFGENTLFAILSLICLILFVLSIINYIERKYNVKILKFIGRKTI